MKQFIQHIKCVLGFHSWSDFMPVGFYRPLDEGSGSKQIQIAVCKCGNVLGRVLENN
mgnify:CR=1 FL=1